MTKKALLICGQESETSSTLARNLIQVGGMSLFTRQMKQMKAIGVEEIHVVSDWFIQDFNAEIEKCRTRPEKIFLHSSKDAPLKLLEHNTAGNEWILLEEGVILDERIIKMVMEHPSPTILTMIGPNDFLSCFTALAIPLRLEKQAGFFGSIAKISSHTLATNIRKLNSLDGLANALKAISRADDCAIANVIDIPLYRAELRRMVDLVWCPVIRREDSEAACRNLLEASQRGDGDWPARFIHRPIENIIVKYLCKIPVSPNQVTIFATLLGFFAIYLFIKGHLMPALLGAYLVAILDGVDGKLARLKLQVTKIGRFSYLLARFVEYGWYFALGYYLSSHHGMAPLIMAGAMILFHLADEIQAAFFYRMTAIQLSAADKFDRKFQLIAGRRNTHLWALLPFALFDQWFIGFAFICSVAIATFFIHQFRFIYHLKNIMIESNETFAGNFKNTKIL